MTSTAPHRSALARTLSGSLAIALLGGAAVAATSVAASAAPLPETLISTAETTWSYSDDNTDPSAGQQDRLSWTTADFDDAAWQTATGAFGAKRGEATGIGDAFPITTKLNQYIDGKSAPDVKTFHFRSEFSLDAEQLDQVAELQAKVTYDDAVQIFVNGEKVAGFADADVEAAPESERNLMYAGEGKGDPQSSQFTIPADKLQEGENTVAVALYQDREDSSDIYFDFASLAPVSTDTPAEHTNIVQTIGSDESSRNVTWYTNRDEEQSLQVAPAPADGTEFPVAEATTVAATGEQTTSGEFNRRATITGLAENSSYVYRVGSEEGGWSEQHKIQTKSFSGDYSFLFFGDPQVGASGNLANDEAGWNDTVDVALDTYPNSEMLFSAGDQVNTASSEDEYDTYLSPEAMQDLATVPMNGNHDVGSKAYEQHYTVPNLDAASGAATSDSSSGGDYWFEYKDVLFVVLNSNSNDFDSHTEFMKKVVAEHGDDAKWKVLAFHHSIYSIAKHVNDDQIKDLRAALPETISTLGFDLVLQGHDHSYTRTYLIKNGELADASEVPGQAEVSADEGEVLYVTANSASGSKYYDITAPDAWYGSVMNQEKVRNYTNIDVTDKSIKISTLRSEQNGAEKPVNSLVDQVTLTRDRDEPAPTAPELQLPESVEQGGTLEATGSGFLADEKLTAEIHSDPVSLGELTADAEGNAAVSWNVPADFEAGQHELVVTRADGSEVRGTFEVKAAEKPGTDGTDPGTGTTPGTDGTDPGTGADGASPAGTSPKAGGTGAASNGLATTGGQLPAAGIGLAALLVLSGAVFLFARGRRRSTGA